MLTKRRVDRVGASESGNTVRDIPPLRVLLPILIGALIGKWRNERAWREAREAITDAAGAYGEYLKEGDLREQRMFDLARRQVRLGALSLSIAVGSLVVAVVAVWYGGGSDIRPARPSGPEAATSLSYYELAAQVIPVLFVALVLESRFLQPRPPDAPQLDWLTQLRELTQFVAVLAPFVIGEWAALQVLQNGTPRPGQQETVTASLVVCAATLLFPVILRQARGLGRVAEEVVQWVVTIGLVAAVVVLLTT